ncbi:hypothetical protein CFBP2533_32170 [Xanthomonas hortorum pv. pelargonii]|uniref:Transposase IS4-like domain-containing protein n=1 Tax=Xanthomonas hortorum pv. pelargonii TaxID=453602 RepID=A0A6V7E737_9XANT|nr:hypothetical protein CFBP2533_32170 [Xanthomonas hortorum pv. pelargonii]CAD0346999.1 hypothetical protein CFBP2533_32170 [Xanthomonas hortorum pv. pelargonii]
MKGKSLQLHFESALGKIAEGRPGVPLAVRLTGTNRHDSVVFEESIDALPPIGGKPGRPRRWPDKLHADQAYDIARCRTFLKQRGIIARIARKDIERNHRLGRHRWVVERTHAWFAGLGKLRIRFERRIDLHMTLLLLAPSSADDFFLGFVNRP